MARIKEKVSFTAFGVNFVDIPYWNVNEKEYSVGVKGTASMVRQYLKAKYPKYKFWASSESYSGGDSIRAAGWYLPESAKPNKNNSDNVERQLYSELQSIFQEGKFNGMEDIYENGDMQKIIAPDGKSIDYGTKYMFFSNKPPYESKEYNMPVPNWDEVPEPKKEKPSPKKYEKSDKKESLANFENSTKIAELSTGYDMYLYRSYPDMVEIVFVFDYKVGKKLYKDWKDLKAKMEAAHIVWDLRLKAFFAINVPQSSKDFEMADAYELYLKPIYDGYMWHLVDDMFKDGGYTSVRPNKAFYTPLEKEKDILIDGEDKSSSKKEQTPIPAPIPEPEKTETSNGLIPLEYGQINWAEGTGNWDGTMFNSWDNFKEGLHSMHTETGQKDQSYKTSVKLVFNDGKEIKNISFNTSDEIFVPGFQLGEYLKTLIVGLSDEEKEKYNWTDNTIPQKTENKKLPAPEPIREQKSPLKKIIFNHGQENQSETMFTWKDAQDYLENMWHNSEYYNLIDIDIMWENGAWFVNSFFLGSKGTSYRELNPTEMSLQDFLFDCFIAKGDVPKMDGKNVDETTLSWSDDEQKPSPNPEKKKPGRPRKEDKDKTIPIPHEDVSELIADLEILNELEPKPEISELIEDLKILQSI